MSFGDRKTALLFDVDGTLTLPRQTIDPSTRAALVKAKANFVICLVSGSDYKKVCEQMGDQVDTEVDYVFSENGLFTKHAGRCIERKSIIDHLGEKDLQRFTNFCLRYISELNLPFKRGTFIELRNGLINPVRRGSNVSPVGRNCAPEERTEFEEFDKEHCIRELMISELRREFSDLNLMYSIGGQISFDVFPMGWDKTFCLDILNREGIVDIHFFGDKVHEGGNDYEIYHDKRVKGHGVSGPQYTVELIQSLSDR